MNVLTVAKSTRTCQGAVDAKWYTTVMLTAKENITQITRRLAHLSNQAKALKPFLQVFNQRRSLQKTVLTSLRIWNLSEGVTSHRFSKQSLS
jgi:hypothetical protein